jgi:hypothetical protein
MLDAAADEEARIRDAAPAAAVAALVATGSKASGFSTLSAGFCAGAAASTGFCVNASTATGARTAFAVADAIAAGSVIGVCIVALASMLSAEAFFALPSTKTVKTPGVSTKLAVPQRLGVLSPSRRISSTLKLAERG